jgi:spermidine synthase
MFVPTPAHPGPAIQPAGRRVSNLLTLKIPLAKVTRTLRLLEPPDSCKPTLCARVLTGTYRKPFIIDRKQHRSLHFDLETVQSAMNLKDPDALSLAYTRKMMAFLLFQRDPERVLLLGLGGGSLAKFCYRRLLHATITAVEVNPDVIALREEFRIPTDDDRFRVICANGASYLKGSGRSKDVILADACNRDGTAPECDTIEFYERARQRLTDQGMFVTNMCNDTLRCAVQLAKIRTVFGSEPLVLRAGPRGNIILFAFKGKVSEINWEHLEAVAVELKTQFELDFPRYVRRLATYWKVRRWSRLFA